MSERAPRCEMCGGLGWVLDCSDLERPGPRMVEIIECLLPDCQPQPVQRVVLKVDGLRFTEVSRHPKTGVVMSIGAGLPALAEGGEQ